LNVQVANDLWAATSQSGQSTSTYTNSFTGFTCDSYAKAWIVTPVYGAVVTNTATITVTVNGHTVGSPTVGTTGDANANVYGSSVGIWLLSLPIDPGYLYTNGTANEVSVQVSNKTQGSGASAVFDGRSNYQALVTITKSAALNNTLDYAFAAGGGDIGTSAGYVTSRTLDFGSIGSGTISQADLYAVYTYGDYAQNDKLLLNDVSLFGDNAANKNNNDASVTYPADFLHAYSALLQGVSFRTTGNTLKFTVDSADVSSGEGSLRPQLAVLGVTLVPEPASLAIVALGGLALLAKRRRA